MLLYRRPAAMFQETVSHHLRFTQQFPPFKKKNPSTNQGHLGPSSHRCPWALSGHVDKGHGGSKNAQLAGGRRGDFLQPVKLQMLRSIFFCQRLRKHTVFWWTQKRKKQRRKSTLGDSQNKNNRFSLCRPIFLVGFFLASSIPLIKSWPYRWLRQVWHQRSQHMGPSWKLGKPCRARRPGLFRLQTQILCVARNSLGTDFKSSRRKRPYVIMLIMLIFVMGGGLFWDSNL